MTSRCEAILFSLLGVAKKHGKKYAFPSQSRLEELVEKYHGFEFSNRTLNRDLRFLEDEGYIKRVRRLRRGDGGKPVYTSTLYKFTGKLFNWLFSLGNQVKRLFSGFRLPKWADYQLSQKLASVVNAQLQCGKVAFVDKVGSVRWYDPATGQVSNL